MVIDSPLFMKIWLYLGLKWYLLIWCYLYIPLRNLATYLKYIMKKCARGMSIIGLFYCVHFHIMNCRHLDMAKYVLMNRWCLSVCVFDYASVCVSLCLCHLYSLNVLADWNEISHKYPIWYGPVYFLLRLWIPLLTG